MLADYAKVALALILDPSGGLFSDAARPGQRPFSYWAQTCPSRIGIRDENRCFRHQVMGWTPPLT